PAQPLPGTEVPPGSIESFVALHLPLKEARRAWTESFELVYVRAMLKMVGGNVTRAAERAGVSRRFLQRLVARLGIKPSDGLIAPDGDAGGDGGSDDADESDSGDD